MEKSVRYTSQEKQKLLVHGRVQKFMPIRNHTPLDQHSIGTQSILNRLSINSWRSVDRLLYRSTLNGMSTKISQLSNRCRSNINQLSSESIDQGYRSALHPRCLEYTIPSTFQFSLDGSGVYYHKHKEGILRMKLWQPEGPPSGAPYPYRKENP